jgi:hypothetical protein
MTVISSEYRDVTRVALRRRLGGLGGTDSEILGDVPGGVLNGSARYGRHSSLAAFREQHDHRSTIANASPELIEPIRTMCFVLIASA